jgi:threonine dehydrogenase-like Zn-dependent dehydrogenase
MVTVDSHSTLCPIAEDVPIALATFAYPLASGLEWVNRLASLRPGESVAVVGASRIGVAVVAAASLGSPSRITLFGASDAEAARDAADRLGAHIAAGFSDYESPFDVVIVVTEATAEEAMQGLALAAPMGRVVLASTSTSTFPLQPESVRRRGLLVRGGRAHTIESLQNAVEAVSTRPDWLEPTFVETYPLEEAAAALQDLHDAAGNPRGVHALVSVPQ